MRCWLGVFDVLAEKIFFPIVAFPPGNETKFSSTICDMKLGEMLPGGDLSEFMLVHFQQ